MRAGTEVVYVDPRGEIYPATVTAVVGSGPSGFKLLALSYGDGKAVDQVRHQKDQPTGAGYWSFERPERPPVRRFKRVPKPAAAKERNPEEETGD